MICSNRYPPRHPRTRQARAILLTLASLPALCAAGPLVGQTIPGAAASTITLTRDAASAPVATVVHFSAAVVAGLGVPTGKVTFFDSGNAISTVPLDRTGVAAVGVASFKAGSHLLTAVYSGDAVYAVNSSASVSVTVTPLQAALGLTTSAAQSLTSAPVTLAAAGLPAPATGTVTFADNGTAIASARISGATVSAYVALGASITFGASLNTPLTDRYPSLYAASLGLALTDLGVPGYQSCSVLSMEILPNHIGPSQASAPLSSLEIGTNDAEGRGMGAWEATYNLCDQAALAWLAIPREYKVLAGDPQVTLPAPAWTYTGSLTDGTLTTAFNDSGTGTATFPITTSGAPVYLWYLLEPLYATNFSVTIDGMLAETVNSAATGGYEATGTGGFGLLRLPVSSGAHVVKITALGGTVGILGVATPPSPGAASVHPTVLASDVTNIETIYAALVPTLTPAVIAAYSADIGANVALLAADGLDVRLVPTHAFLTGDSSQYADPVHPNPLGHQLLCQAFQAVTQGIDVSKFASFTNATPNATVAFDTAGTHTLTASYSGDNTYSTAQSPAAQETVLLTPTLTTLSAPSTSALAGSPITLRAAVNAAAATGTLTFLDGATALQQVALTAGSASFTLTTLAPGAHTLSAAYAGDAAYLPSQSPALALQINANPTTVTLSALAATLPYGSSASLTVTLAPLAATGSVQLLDTFTAPGQPAVLTTLATTPASSGIATFALTALPVGSHVLSAFYAGDLDDLAAASPAATLAVTALPTSTTLSPPPGPITYGTALTLTASTNPAAGGTVTFADALSGHTYPGALTAGIATVTIAALQPGTHPFTAAFGGDATHAPSTSPAVNAIVNPVTAAVALGPLPASLPYGTPLTVVASTTPASATGTVIFRDAKVGILGQVPLVAGVASLSLPAPSAAVYAITATYSGDTFDTTATSPAVTITIIAKPTTVLLQPLPVTQGFGLPVTLSAVLSPSAATGMVTFVDLGGTVASAPLLNGVATATLATLSSGPHAISATYAGDGQYAAATSAASTITITPTPTSVSLTQSQSAVPAGAPALFTAKIVAAGSVTPAGLVTLRSGTTVLGSGPISIASLGLGYATIPVDTTTLALGSYPVAAFYAGDPQDIASNSAAITLTVVPVPVTLAVTLSAAQIVAQSPVTVTATVVSTPGPGVASAALVPTGSIVFASNGTTFATVVLAGSAADTASATASLSTLAIGAYAITATYAPSGVFATTAAAASTSLNVTPPFTLTLAPSTISAPAGTTQSVGLTLTPVSGFTGTLSTNCSSPVAFLTCTIAAPTSLTGSAPAAATITVTIPALNPAAATLAPRSGLLPVVFAALLLPLALVGRRRIIRLPLLSALVGMLLLAGCGGMNSNPPDAVPAGTQIVTVSASVNGTSVSTSLIVHISK